MRRPLSASYELMRAPPPAPPHQWHGLREELAALSASTGGPVDRSCLDPARGLAVSGATVATTSGEVSKQKKGEAARGGGLHRRRASTWRASRASLGMRGPLGCHEGP